MCRNKKKEKGEQWAQELNGNLQKKDHSAAWRMIKELKATSVNKRQITTKQWKEHF